MAYWAGIRGGYTSRSAFELSLCDGCLFLNTRFTVCLGHLAIAAIGSLLWLSRCKDKRLD